MEALSKQELLSLLGAARGHRERDWLMILVAFWHGLRASEVIAIRRDDIHNGHLTVKRLKGSLQTTQLLIESPESLLNERAPLIEFAARAGGNQRIFNVARQTFWAIMQRHAASAGLPARLRHPHILKHSIALQTIHAAGIENVRQYLGHRSMSSTGEYLRVSDEDAARAVRAALAV